MTTKHDIAKPVDDLLSTLRGLIHHCCVQAATEKERAQAEYQRLTEGKL